VESEDFWVIDDRNGLDILVVSLNFLRWICWDLISEISLSSFNFDFDFSVAMVWLQDSVFQIVLAIGVKHFSVQIVCDSSSVLHLADHVPDNVHLDDLIWLLAALRWGGDQIGQVFLDETERGFQIRVVELVRDAPTKRSELLPFDDN
jgi:hypothetical protein